LKVARFLASRAFGRMRRDLAIAAFVAAFVLPAASAAATAKLEYHGTVLARRQVETLAAPALRAPNDSAEVARVLVSLIGRLQDLGYLDARVVARNDSASGRFVIEAREGEKVRLRSLRLETGSPSDSVAFMAGLGLTPGMDVSPSGLSAAVTRAVERLSSTGHPYAELGVRSLDWDASGARVRLNGVLGPAVTVSRVRVDGLNATRPSVVQRVVGRLEGTTYDRTEVEAGRERLVQLGLFRNVTFQGIEGEDDPARAQVVYRVDEPHYNQFEGTVGLQGQGQVVGLAHVELANLAGPGRAAALRWEGRGAGVAAVAARYAEPLLLGLPLRGEIALEQLVQDTIYTRTRWGATLTFALSGHERLEAGYQQERVVQPDGSLERADLQTTTFALVRDVRDEPLWPRRGTRMRLGAAQSFKSETLRPEGRSTARASAIEGELDAYHDLRGHTGISLELSSAGRFSTQRVLPIYERYPLGGAASLRGHDEEEFRVDRYGLARLEWRLFLGEGHQRVALFWDHATMQTRIDLPAGGDRVALENADGFGFGLRLEAVGGLIGLDYGLAPGKAPLEGKIHLQLITAF